MLTKGMKTMNYANFVTTHATCSRIAENEVAKHIYEKIIWKDENRIKFVELSENQIPALAACAKEIEEYCKNNPGFDLNDSTNKRIIGRMVRDAILPLGFESECKKRMPTGLQLNEFKNATMFKYHEGTEIEKIEKKIVQI